MTNAETICATEVGRRELIRRIATTEDCAVQLLDEIRKQLPEDSWVNKLAWRHRRDEFRHGYALAELLADMGGEVKRDARTQDWLMGVYSEIAPKTAGEKYQLLQIIEERSSEDYLKIAEALKPHDTYAASLFYGMVNDESSHIKYCQAAIKELGGPQRLARYREIYTHPIEVYDRQKHFAEISSWGPQLDPDALGIGYVIPGRCCGFAGVIGGTKTVYFYSLRANPSANRITRGLAILRLARRIVADARAAGLTRGLTETSNSVVERFWVEREGFATTGESILQGRL